MSDCRHCGHSEEEHKPGFLCKATPTEGRRYWTPWGDCTCPGWRERGVS